MDEDNLVSIRTDGALRTRGPTASLDRDMRWGAPGRATPPGAWIDAAAGSDFFCAAAANGSVASWSDKIRPEMQPPIGVHFVRIGAHGNMACGVDDRGEVHCWGDAITWFRGDVFAAHRLARRRRRRQTPRLRARARRPR